VVMAEALLELGDPRGFGPMIDVIANGEAAQARRDAWEHLKAHADIDVPYRAELSPSENAAAVADLRKWWKENESRLAQVRPGVFGPKG